MRQIKEQGAPHCSTARRSGGCNSGARGRVDRCMRVRLIGELNDFLPVARRGRSLSVVLDRRASLKDILEAQGVPHTEIGGVLLDGSWVELHTVCEIASAARVIVVPEGPGAVSDIRVPTPMPLAFVADVHLGALTRRLRLAGFDVAYGNDWSTTRLIAEGAGSTRVLLTRDRRLLRRAVIVHARFVRADDVATQFDDIVAHYALAGQMQPFSRCSDCNTPLESVPKARIQHRLEPLTRAYFSRFARCPGCDKLYWGGSHVADVRRRLDPARTASQDGAPG